jgi:RNA polymerase sigma-70 factor (ECF subfamily)
MPDQGYASMTMAQPVEYARGDTSKDELFSTLFEEHSDLAYNVAYRIVGNPQDAEEAMQEAFLSAYSAFDSFQGRSKFTTWLYRIVVNASLMKIRKNKAQVNYLSRAEQDESFITDRSINPESSVANSELRVIIIEWLNRLTPALKAAVVLKDVQQLTNEEAAGALAISVPAFKSRLHRARMALREHLESVMREY